jgi:hypothetical protein
VEQVVPNVGMLDTGSGLPSFLLHFLHSLATATCDRKTACRNRMTLRAAVQRGSTRGGTLLW